MQTQITKLRLSKMREAGTLNKVAIMKMDRLRGFIGKRERQRYLRHVIWYIIWLSLKVASIDENMH